MNPNFTDILIAKLAIVNPDLLIIFVIQTVFVVVGRISVATNAIHVKLDTLTILHAQVCIFPALVILQKFLIFCSECECNEDGSVDERCDDEGKCSCKSNVIGDKCSECQPDHYDYPRCEGKENYPGFGQIIFKFFFSL